MAQAGVDFRAVGASLGDLARACRAMPAQSLGAFAYANSGVAQQAGVVFLGRYITAGDYSADSGNRKTYTEPPGATHGPVVRSNKDANGNFMRNSKGQFIYAAVEKKRYIKGKFVSRTGEMKAFARELAATAPASDLNAVLAFGLNTRSGTSGGDLTASIDNQGRFVLEITGGYKAAEVGSRSGVPMGVKGWWRALRSAQGRWSTLIRKKYPELIRIRPTGAL